MNCFQHVLCKPEPFKQPHRPMCEMPFVGDTNYRHDYVPWNVKPCIVKPDNKYVPPEVPMEGLSTNRVSTG